MNDVQIHLKEVLEQEIELTDLCEEVKESLDGYKHTAESLQILAAVNDCEKAERELDVAKIVLKARLEIFVRDKFKIEIVTEEKARTMLICPGCGKEKTSGMVVCWVCFKSHEEVVPFKYFDGSLEDWLKMPQEKDAGDLPNIPAECEDKECTGCTENSEFKKQVECPFLQ